MDERDQNQNPMSFMSEVMDKMWGGDREGGPGRAMMDALQDAAGRAQKAQAAMFENMREFMPEGMTMPGMGGGMGGPQASRDDSGDAEDDDGTSAAFDEMQKMFGQMTQPWTAFLQLDRAARLKLMERHRAMVASYLDMLDSAIETLSTDLAAQQDEEA